jgi:hypothetical protein
MPIEDYSHMMMEMKLMVDGDEGGEDDLRSPSLGEKSWIDLILKSLIVALAALCFANILLLLGHPFSIYKRVYAKARGKVALEGRTSRPHAARESGRVGHARLGLEHSLVSLRCSDSFT